jgi:hypothetical protein
LQAVNSSSFLSGIAQAQKQRPKSGVKRPVFTEFYFEKTA